MQFGVPPFTAGFHFLPEHRPSERNRNKLEENHGQYREADKIEYNLANNFADKSHGYLFFDKYFRTNWYSLIFERMILNSKLMQIDLSSKKILITGASKGIGLAIAQQVVAAGAAVVLHYRSDNESLIELKKEYPSQKIELVCADMNKPEDVQFLWEQSVQALGSLTGVVLNAGIFTAHAIEDSSADWMHVWQKTMQVNLNAIGQLTHLALQSMPDSGGGQLVFIASRAAFRGETADYLAYAASKGGVVSLGKTVARSFGKKGIISFIVAPGFTKTQMAEDFIAQAGEQKIIDELGLNELTTPSHISPVVTLMLSGAMNHASGTTVDINAASYMH